MQAIAQTTDGFLWIGMTNGLLRYDGQTFSPYALPGRASIRVASLAATSDGSLWIGSDSGLLRLHEGSLQSFSKDGEIQSIAPAGPNTVWVQRAETVERCTSGRDDCEEWISPMKQPGRKAVYADGHEGFWQSAGLHLYHWNGSTGLVYDVPSKGMTDQYAGISTVIPKDGSVLLGLLGPKPQRGLFRLRTGVFEPVPLNEHAASQPGVTTATVDQDGTVWIGTDGSGLYRIRGTTIDHFDFTNGLSGNDVRAVFEDREGSIWVITSQGIDKFHEMPVRTWPTENGPAISVAVLHDGTIVSGSRTLQFWHPNEGRPFRTITRDGLFGITALLVDHSGRLIVAWNDTVSVWDGNSLRTLFHSGDPSKRMIYGLSESPDGTLWVRGAGFVDDKKTLFELRHDRIIATVPRAGDLGGRGLIADLHGFWFSNLAGEIGHYDHGAIRMWRRQTKAIGNTTASLSLLPDGAIMAAEGDGLLLLDNGRYKLLGTTNGLPCSELNGALMDSRGDVWANARCGLLHIQAADFSRWRNQPSSRIPVQHFTRSDGVAMTTSLTSSQMSLAADGTIWFATESGLQSIDPARLDRRALPVKTSIEEMLADRNTINELTGIRLPPKTDIVEIRYAGLSFVRPERVRFETRLDGLDKSWIDARERRSVVYAHLLPGQYRFRVRARKDSEPWGEEQSVAFKVRAAWYQTMLFRLLLLASSCAICVVFYLWRVRALEQQMFLRTSERMMERTRMARDLHDTLLQTVQGSRMLVEHAREMADVTSMRRALDRASSHLEQAVKEGRTALLALRNDHLENRDLEEHIRYVVDAIAGNTGILTPFHTTGISRDVRSIVRVEIVVILTEAMRNIVQHARATLANVSIDYEDALLRVSIRDNGAGIASNVLTSGKHGHFGLQSMRERAGAINATLRLVSETGVGTTIIISVPGAFAYASRTSQFRAGISALTSLCLRLWRPDTRRVPPAP